MYITELQELYSAESQWAALAESLVGSPGSAELPLRIQEYASELAARKSEPPPGCQPAR